MAVNYPVDMQIEMLLASFVDENGEVTCTEEDMEQAIAQIHLEFDEKILSLRNAYKATALEAKLVEAEAKALREEATQVQKRANALNNSAERTKRFIAYLLQGETYKKNGCSITYRKSEACVVEDGFTEWAVVHAPELLKVEPKTSEIKNALANGISVDFAHIEERNNIQIR